MSGTMLDHAVRQTMHGTLERVVFHSGDNGRTMPCLKALGHIDWRGAVRVDAVEGTDAGAGETDEGVDNTLWDAAEGAGVTVGESVEGTHAGVGNTRPEEEGDD